MWVEQRGELRRNPAIRSEQAIVLHHRDELAKPLVELIRDEAIERDAAVKQQHECIARNIGHGTIAQRDGIITSRLIFQQRSFAEPSTARDACKADGLPLARHARNFYEAVDDAEPIEDRLALLTNEGA